MRNPAKHPAERFWAYVTICESGCWLWQGALNNTGYGRFTVGYRRDNSLRMLLAHRYAYEQLVSPIPDGLELDHLCRVPRCINPAHLEPVTHKENCRRGNAMWVGGLMQRSKTHCKQGHPYDEANTIYWGNKRKCRICNRIGAKLRWRKKHWEEKREK